MRARLTTIWLPPSRLPEALRFFAEEVVPAMLPQPGLRGVWLLVDRPAGKQLAIGLWDSDADLEATTFLYQELRAKVGSLYGGPPVDEAYEARPPEQGIYTVRAEPPPHTAAAAQVARVTTVQGTPERVEDLVRQLEAQIAPALVPLRTQAAATLGARVTPTIEVYEVVVRPDTAAGGAAPRQTEPRSAREDA